MALSFLGLGAGFSFLARPFPLGFSALAAVFASVAGVCWIGAWPVAYSTGAAVCSGWVVCSGAASGRFARAFVAFFLAGVFFAGFFLLLMVAFLRGCGLVRCRNARRRTALSYLAGEAGSRLFPCFSVVFFSPGPMMAETAERWEQK